MRQYTATYTNKAKQVVQHKYKADGHKDALAKAKSFDAWPNVVITDDTYTVIPGYGERIYINGIIVDNGNGFLLSRPNKIEALVESHSAYDAAITTLRRAAEEIFHKVDSFTERPSKVKFFKDLGVAIQKLEFLCKEEAAKNDEPCRWI